MTRYTIELTDGSLEDAEADNFHVQEGFVTFYCYDGHRTRSVVAYPVGRVKGVTSAGGG